MKTFLLMVAVTSAVGLAPAHAATGSTGNPVNWVQVGETTDTFLLIDANSIAGFEAPNLGLAHRADYMFKGKKSDNFTSVPKTAFMVQGECDDGRGNLTLFVTGENGQPKGKGETQKFKLDGETWVDAVARTMCKARQIMMDNQRAR
jgi:hypothetical protein